MWEELTTHQRHALKTWKLFSSSEKTWSFSVSSLRALFVSCLGFPVGEEHNSTDRGRLRCKQLGDLRMLAQEAQTSTQLTPNISGKASLPPVPRRGLWKALNICALDGASKPAGSAFLAPSSGLSDAVTRQTRGPPQSYASQDHNPPRPKHLRFLLGIGKLLSDRIPSFPAQADFFHLPQNPQLGICTTSPGLSSQEVLLHKFQLHMLSAGLSVSLQKEGLKKSGQSCNKVASRKLETKRRLLGTSAN